MFCIFWQPRETEIQRPAGGRAPNQNVPFGNENSSEPLELAHDFWYRYPPHVYLFSRSLASQEGVENGNDRRDCVPVASHMDGFEDPD